MAKAADGVATGFQVGNTEIAFETIRGGAGLKWEGSAASAISQGFATGASAAYRIPALRGKAEITASLSESKTELKKVLDDLVSQVDSSLEDSSATVTETLESTSTEMTAAQETVSTNLNKKADKIAKDAEKATTALGDKLEAGLAKNEETISGTDKTLAAHLKKIDEMKKCLALGQVYNPTKNECQAPSSPAPKQIHFRKLPNRNWHGTGHVPTRDFTFNKKSEQTNLRIRYYDNFRVGAYTGHTCQTKVRLQIDGQECSDPGDINWHRHSQAGRHGGRYQNNHFASHMSGLCKKVGNKHIGKGNHQIKVHMFWHNGCGLYSGWDNQYAYIEVEEIFIEG